MTPRDKAEARYTEAVRAREVARAAAGEYKPADGRDDDAEECARAAALAAVIAQFAAEDAVTWAARHDGPAGCVECEHTPQTCCRLGYHVNEEGFRAAAHACDEVAAAGYRAALDYRESYSGADFCPGPCRVAPRPATAAQLTRLRALIEGLDKYQAIRAIDWLTRAETPAGVNS